MPLTGKPAKTSEVHLWRSNNKVRKCSMLKRLNTFINHFDLNVQDFFVWLRILGLFTLKIVKPGMGHSKLVGLVNTFCSFS